MSHHGDNPVAWSLVTPATIAEAEIAVAMAGDDVLGVSEEAGHVTVWARTRLDLDLPGTWTAVADEDWLARWRDGIEPVRIGPLLVTPSWLATGSDDEIVLDPGLAFGTGHHETTTGCLAALCEADLTGRRVLDLGTGTGVLAICAHRLGAAAVTGVDTDPDAIEVARANVVANGVTVDLVVGSVDAVGGDWDIVVANLDTATLVALAAGIVDRLGPRGTLIASGVSRPRAHEAVAAFDAAGLPVRVREGHEWVVLIGHRPPVAPR